MYEEDLFGYYDGDEFMIKSVDDIRKEYYPIWKQEIIEEFGSDEGWCFLDCIDYFCIKFGAYRI